MGREAEFDSPKRNSRDDLRDDGRGAVHFVGRPKDFDFERDFVSSAMLTCLSFFLAETERLLFSVLSFFGDEGPSFSPDSEPSSTLRFLSVSRFSWWEVKGGR